MSARSMIGGISFAVPEDLAKLSVRIDRFVREKIIPYETDTRWTAHGPTDELRLELNQLARSAGLFAPHVEKEFGGLGLSHLGRAIAFTAAGYSMLGPVALNCAAPDEGNVHLLSSVASKLQRKRYLAPLARGESRSCFCMTEPAPGAGSDPEQLATSAKPDGDGFVIDGLKWLISGAEGAGFAIIMAKIPGEGIQSGATMFLTPMNRPGIMIERSLETIDSSFVGGHSVVYFNGLRVSRDDILGKPGEGYRYAQVRLAAARLSHCMRWLGSAKRAHDVATEYARRRTAFGKAIGEHAGVSFQLADNAIDLHACELVIWHVAWLMDKGSRVSKESSMAKVMCSEAIGRIVDRSMQILGGLGTTRDTVVERIYRDVRAFRIYDGPSEVHRWALGRRIVSQDPPKQPMFLGKGPVAEKARQKEIPAAS